MDKNTDLCHKGRFSNKVAQMSLVDLIADFQAAAVAGKSIGMTPADLAAGFSRKFSAEEISDLVVPKRTLARRIAKREPLSPDETNRAMRVGSITVEAERVFADAARAHRWLRRLNPALSDQRPIDLLQSEAGAQAVETLLGQIDHGMFI